jgi:anti-sigma regulatory factor (Ser/Thr protein kinase)
VLGFDGTSIAEVRRVVAGHGKAAGLSRERIADLVLAAHELATNSIRHGGGRGALQLWSEPDAVLCQVRDHGHIEDPLLDRTRPSCEAENGRGLWMANQLCELVQVRSFGTETSPETVVRLHMRRSPT